MSNEPENREPDASPPGSPPPPPAPQPMRPRVESALGAPVAPTKAWQLPATPRPPPPPRPVVRPPAAPSRPAEAPKVSNEPAATIAEPDAVATAMALRAAREAKEKHRPFWVWTSLGDSVRNFRSRAQRLGAWWRHWRTTAAFRVLLAFVAIYGLLGVVRKPSDVVVERSRRAEGAIFLREFLKRYCAAGGPVLAVRPHGGTEIFPRGVVLQEEMLAAFFRAPVGATFVVKTSGTAWNPLAGFYGYPPIFAGGVYFVLERKFNFTLYEFTFLIRKDSERAGAMLIGRVEVAL